MISEWVTGLVGMALSIAQNTARKGAEGGPKAALESLPGFGGYLSRAISGKAKTGEHVAEGLGTILGIGGPIAGDLVAAKIHGDGAVGDTLKSYIPAVAGFAGGAAGGAAGVAASGAAGGAAGGVVGGSSSTAPGAVGASFGDVIGEASSTAAGNIGATVQGVASGAASAAGDAAGAVGNATPTLTGEAALGNGGTLLQAVSGQTPANVGATLPSLDAAAGGGQLLPSVQAPSGVMEAIKHGWEGGGLRSAISHGAREMGLPPSVSNALGSGAGNLGRYSSQQAVKMGTGMLNAALAPKPPEPFIPQPRRPALAPMQGMGMPGMGMSPQVIPPMIPPIGFIPPARPFRRY